MSYNASVKTKIGIVASAWTNKRFFLIFIWQSQIMMLLLVI